jgi:hypothetical protein
LLLYDINTEERAEALPPEKTAEHSDHCPEKAKEKGKEKETSGLELQLSTGDYMR